MRNIVKHAAIPGYALPRGMVIAGLALTLPLGIGAGTVARQSVPAHPVAAIVPSGPAIVAHRVAIAPPVPGSAGVAHRPRTVTPAHGGAPGGTPCNGGVVSGTVTPFSEHMNHAHFERSPEQQVSDVSQTSDYVKLHVVLLQNMSQPALGDLSGIPEGSGTPFMEHMDHAHIHRSPQQQASDAQQTDDYVKLHTVLVERMLEPIMTALGGDC